MPAEQGMPTDKEGTTRPAVHHGQTAGEVEDEAPDVDASRPGNSANGPGDDAPGSTPGDAAGGMGAGGVGPGG